MTFNLERYVSDNSLRLFGIADRSMIEYLISSAASSSKTPERLFTALSSAGLPDTPDAHAFTSELFSKVPRKHKHKRTSSDSARKQAEKDAKALRSQKFGFLLEDDEE
ncbi:hypothetical protein GALMADRAFT_16001, partial [Galerina marginata CBS 339.88]